MGVSSEVDPATKELVALFERSGHIRLQKPERLREGPRRYKKGDEIRIGAASESELAHVRDLLAACGFTLGAPHAHGSGRFRQPVYGRDQVARFVEMLEEVRR